MPDIKNLQELHARNGAPTNKDWWPERLNLTILAKNPRVINPQDDDLITKQPSSPSTSRL